MTRRCGPETYRRYLTDAALIEGNAWWLLHWVEGMSYGQIAAAVGRPKTTVWRHTNLAHDHGLPRQWGNPLPRRVPPMRGTARQPRSRPYVAGHDGPVELAPPRHLVPAMRCSAHRRDGHLCRRWCRRGAVVCPGHGGSAPQVREAARLRVARLEAESRELEWRDPDYRRARHHEALKLGAARRTLFAGPEFRRLERTEARQRRTE